MVTRAKQLVKIIGTVVKPDSGRTVQIKNRADSIITTATEIPASSGYYVAVYEPVEDYGTWWCDGVKLSNDNAPLWLGIEDAPVFASVKAWDATFQATDAGDVTCGNIDASGGMTIEQGLYVDRDITSNKVFTNQLNVRGDVFVTGSIYQNKYGQDGKVLTTIEAMSINAGMVETASIIYMGGGGLIQVDAGAFFSYSNSNFQGSLNKYVVDVSSITLSPFVTSFIYASASNGIGNYHVTTDPLEVNESDKVLVAMSYLTDDDVITINYEPSGYGLGNRMLRRINATNKYQPEDGTLLFNLWEKAIYLDAGRVWVGGNYVDLTYIDSVTEQARGYYQSTTGYTTYPFTYLDTNHYADGFTTASLSPNAYGIRWIYRTITETAPRIHVIMDVCNNTTASYAMSIQEPPKNVLPDFLLNYGILLGKVIVHSGSDVPYSVESVYNSTFGKIGAIGGPTVLPVTLITSSMETQYTSSLYSVSAGTNSSITLSDINTPFAMSKTMVSFLKADVTVDVPYRFDIHQVISGVENVLYASEIASGSFKDNIPFSMYREDIAGANNNMYLRFYNLGSSTTNASFLIIARGVL